MPRTSSVKYRINFSNRRVELEYFTKEWWVSKLIQEPTNSNSIANWDLQKSFWLMILLFIVLNKSMLYWLSWELFFLVFLLFSWSKFFLVECFIILSKLTSLAFKSTKNCLKRFYLNVGRIEAKVAVLQIENWTRNRWCITIASLLLRIEEQQQENRALCFGKCLSLTSFLWEEKRKKKSWKGFAKLPGRADRLI